MHDSDPATVRLFPTSERMKIWECFTRPEHRDEWTQTTPFAEFVSRHAEAFERRLT